MANCQPEFDVVVVLQLTTKARLPSTTSGSFGETICFKDGQTIESVFWEVKAADERTYF